MKKGLCNLVIICIVVIMGMFQGCKKATIPELTTAAISEIGINSAVSGGTIIADGGEAITDKGVCWSISTNPTVEGSKTNEGAGTDDFISNLVGLDEGTTYYVRAYATNEIGTAYGNELTFTTGRVTGAVLTTTEISAVTSTTAVAGGNITNDGGGNIIEKGVCWSEAPNPTVAGTNKTINGAGSGLFTSNLTGLTDGTVYYYRAYATNSSGTTYGQELSFITPVTDIEGNVYRTVVIGTQVWMAENLKVTKFNDNTDIPLVTVETEWAGLSTAAYCWYNNEENYFKPLYGALYNWFAVQSGNLCPTGWHFPTDTEYNTLELTIGLPEAELNVWGMRGTDQGSKMKNTSGWNAGENGTNTSGFSALPGGYRYYEQGAFYGQGSISYWWSATQHDDTRAWYRRIDGSNGGIYKASTEKRAGKSVRCIKD